MRSAQRREWLSREERLRIRDLADALDCLQKLRPTMSLYQAMAFLLVVYEEGRTVAEYAEQLGVSAGVAIRHLRDLGDFGKAGEDTLGLLTQKDDPRDAERHYIVVTDKGQDAGARPHPRAVQLTRQ